MGHGHHIEIKQEQFSVPSKGKNFAILLIVVGLILAGIGIATIDRSHGGGHHGEKPKNEASAAAKEHGEHHDAAESHAKPAADHKGNAEVHEGHGNVDNEHFGPRVKFHPQDKPWTTRIWANLLIIGYLLFMVSLAALFFVAVQYIANAGWSAAIKRIPEAMSTFFPVGFVLAFIAILVAKNYLYHWVHYEHLHLKKGDVGFDAILDGKKMVSQ